MATPLPFFGPGDKSQVAFSPDTSGDELGVDLSALSNSLDLDPTFPTQTGFANLGEALVRRLSSPRGGLFYAPNYGTDVRDYLNDSFTNDRVGQVQGAVEAEVLKDDRVLSASCVATFTFATSTLTLQIQIGTASGPFTFVVAVTAVSVTLLNADNDT